MDEPQGELFATEDIGTVPDEITAMALRIFLTEAGIEVAIKEYQASFYGSVLNPAPGYWGKVVVPAGQAKRARELVAQFEKEFQGR